MPLTKSDYESILKIDYQGPIVDQLENSTYLLSRMERMESETGGSYTYMPIRKGRTSSIGARTDGADETVPKGTNPSYGQATFPLRSLYATIRVTGFSMRTSRSDSYAFARASVRDMEDTVVDLKKDVNRQLFGDGSGDLAKITMTATASITTTFTCTSNLYPTRPTRYLYVGQVIDVMNRTTGVAATGTAESLKVKAVNSSTQIELETSTAATAAIAGGTTYKISIFREDNYASTGAKEIYGLHAAINAANPNDWVASSEYIITDFGGVDRTVAANSGWKATERGNSGTLRPFSVSLVAEAIDAIEVEGGGGNISLIQTNHAIYRVYGNLLASARQYDKELDLGGGWKGLELHGIPMVKDVECPDYNIYLVDESTFVLGTTGPWSWINEGGEILTRLPQQDQYEAVMVRDCNLMCNKPSANGRIYDVAHS